MRHVEDRIAALVQLGDWLHHRDEELDDTIQQAAYHNPWFTIENSRLALSAIAEDMLAPEKLNEWIAKYDFNESKAPKTIGLVMAGNLPLVGFHDLLSVLMSGNKALLKLSHKDTLLTKALLAKLEELAPELAANIAIAEQLKGFDAIIATGGNNTARYFEHYFGKYPNIIRKQRNSLAILTGNESKEEMHALGQDVFQYFGLGCRNVSHLLVPQGYDLTPLLDSWEVYASTMDHNKYKNNYDYQRTLLLLNNTLHLASDFVMLTENSQLQSPISTLYYTSYNSEDDIANYLIDNHAALQVVVASEREGTLPFGQSQRPQLWDYADKVDVMEFLMGLE